MADCNQTDAGCEESNVTPLTVKMWDCDHAYNVDDVVSYDGLLYVSKVDGNRDVPTQGTGKNPQTWAGGMSLSALIQYISKGGATWSIISSSVGTEPPLANELPVNKMAWLWHSGDKVWKNPFASDLKISFQTGTNPPSAGDLPVNVNGEVWSTNQSMWVASNSSDGGTGGGGDTGGGDGQVI